MESWSRLKISYCKRPALSYVHTHCPCQKCNGKAVSRSVEYRHWQASTILASASTSIHESPLTTASASTTAPISTEVHPVGKCKLYSYNYIYIYIYINIHICNCIDKVVVHMQLYSCYFSNTYNFHPIDN